MKLDIRELAAAGGGTAGLEQRLDDYDRAVLEDPDRADQRLWRLHFHRDRALYPARREEICTFLGAFYRHTGDVRFFNELLWFVVGGDGLRAHGTLAATTFLSRLDDRGRHPFPGMESAQMRSWLDTALAQVAERRRHPVDRSLRVGLLGSPSFFPVIRRKLAAAGHPVDCYFMPFHPKFQIRLLLTTPPLFSLLRRYKGVDFPHESLPLDPGQAGAVLRDAGLDIGLHKLGFILDEELFTPFRRGLINDHWGLLPFVRGRSSLEFSLLLGVPLAVSTHLVTSVVDGGDLVGIYSYPDLPGRCRNMRQLRHAIRAGLDHRAVDSIGLMARGEGPTLANERVLGRTFTEMHPALVQYVEKTILEAG